MIDWTGIGHLGIGSLLVSFPVAVAFQSPWPLLIGVIVSIPLHILIQFLAQAPKGTVSTEIEYRRRLKAIKWSKGSWQRENAVANLKSELGIRDYKGEYLGRIPPGFGDGVYGE
jgi:hypothetical protein